MNQIATDDASCISAPEGVGDRMFFNPSITFHVIDLAIAIGKQRLTVEIPENVDVSAISAAYIQQIIQRDNSKPVLFLAPKDDWQKVGGGRRAIASCSKPFCTSAPVICASFDEACETSTHPCRKFDMVVICDKTNSQDDNWTMIAHRFDAVIVRFVASLPCWRLSWS